MGGVEKHFQAWHWRVRAVRDTRQHQREAFRFVWGELTSVDIATLQYLEMFRLSAWLHTQAGNKDWLKCNINCYTLRARCKLSVKSKYPQRKQHLSIITRGRALKHFLCLKSQPSSNMFVLLCSYKNGAYIAHTVCQKSYLMINLLRVFSVSDYFYLYRLMIVYSASWLLKSANMATLRKRNCNLC